MAFSFEPLFPSSPTHLPAESAFAITPNDSADLPFKTRGIYVGGTGNLRVDMLNTGTVTFVDVAAGSVLPLCIEKVYATSTTATFLIGLY
jgi:hypothetical protein